MGLNKTDGEPLAGLGRGVVASLEKWAPVMGMLEVAILAAKTEFYKLGASYDIKIGPDEILIQEFHLHRKVVVTCWKVIKGVDRYYNYTFDLSDKVLGELAVVGKWPAVHALPAGSIRAHGQ